MESTVNEGPTCSRCHRRMDRESAWGCCPVCLLETESFGESKDDPSRRFGGYDLVGQIGRGGMGVVYEAQNLALKRRVALKMIVDIHETSPSARRRFAIEAEAAAKLDHPNIVAIYEVGEVEDRPYLSMQLIDGESLARLIRRREYGVVRIGKNGQEIIDAARCDDVAALAAKIARAVHHAHQHGVLHRDLKPANILLDAEGEPHLTDFGLAKILEPDPVAGPGGPTVYGSTGLLGTPNYMSPEQVNHGHLTVATDVYGLGTILYEMLTGRPPFVGHTLIELAQKVANEEPGSPASRSSEIDLGLSTICMKCLEKEPEKRYASALALSQDLENWRSGLPIQACPISRWRRVGRWIRRNPMGTGLIASLAACGVTLALLLQMAHRREEADANGRAWALDRLQKAVQALWDDDTQESVHIHSNDLAALNNETIRRQGTNDVHLSFGLTIGTDPMNLAQAYAPMLRQMEQLMQRELGRPVFLHLDLHKRHSWALLQGGRGQAEIQRIAPLTYVQLRRASGAHLLCQEREGHEAVIFTRRESGVRSWTEAINRKAAFGHTNSVVSFLAKVQLARVGLCITNLQVTNLGIPSVSSSMGGRDETEQEVFAHREVVDRVRKGMADLGVSPSGRFRAVAFKNPPLVELARFRVTPHVYIARADVDPGVVQALRHSLLELDSSIHLSALGSCMGSGFKRVEDSDFDEVRGMLEKELYFFETGDRGRGF